MMSILMHRMITKRAEERMKFCGAALLCAALTACAFEQPMPTQANYDNSERRGLREVAEKGDKDAQYRLGNSYCCGPEGGFWDTKEAVKWWCKAAAQGHPDAAAAVSRVGGNCDRQAAEPPRKL
jgi:TPR repeat protein